MASVDTATPNLKHEAFIGCLPRLVDGLQCSEASVVTVAAQCVGQGIIHHDVHTTVVDRSVSEPDYTTRHLLDAVAERITLEEDVFDKFVVILEAEPSHKPLSLLLTEAHYTRTQEENASQNLIFTEESAEGYSDFPIQQGVPEINLTVLCNELKTVTKPMKLGIRLGVPQEQLDVFKQDHAQDVEGFRTALFGYIANNYRRLDITWESIVEALKDFQGNLALELDEKFCRQVDQITMSDIQLLPSSTSTPVSSVTGKAAYAIGNRIRFKRQPYGTNPVSDVFMNTFQNTLMIAVNEEQHRKDLQVELADKDKQLRVSQSQKEKLQTKLDELFAQYEKLVSEKTAVCVSFEKDIERLKSDLSKKETERNELLEKCHDYESRIDDQSSRILALSTETSDHNEHRKSLTSEIAYLNEQIAILTEQNSGAKQVLEIKRHEVETLRAQSQEATKAFKACEESSIVNKLNIEINKCRRKIEQVTIDLQVHKEVVLRLMRANRQHSIREEELKKECKNLSRRCSIAERLYREDHTFVIIVSVLMGFVAITVVIVSVYSSV